MTEEARKAERKRLLAEIASNREQAEARGVIRAPDAMKPLGSFADDDPKAHDANAEPDAKEK